MAIGDFLVISKKSPTHGLTIMNPSTSVHGTLIITIHMVWAHAHVLIEHHWLLVWAHAHVLML